MDGNLPSGPPGAWRGYDRPGTSTGWPQPGPPPGYPPPGYPVGPPQPPPLPSSSPPPRKRRTWPIVVAVVAGVAALALLVAGLIWMLETTFAGLDEDLEDPAESTMTGRLPTSHRPGTGVTGDELADAVIPVIEDDYVEVDDLTCPSAPRVDQSVTLVCHGRIEDEPSSIVVIFEDQAGRFTLVWV